MIVSSRPKPPIAPRPHSHLSSGGLRHNGRVTPSPLNSGIPGQSSNQLSSLRHRFPDWQSHCCRRRQQPGFPGGQSWCHCRCSGEGVRAAGLRRPVTEPRRWHGPGGDRTIAIPWSGASLRAVSGARAEPPARPGPDLKASRFRVNLDQISQAESVTEIDIMSVAAAVGDNFSPGTALQPLPQSLAWSVTLPGGDDPAPLAQPSRSSPSQ